ncbi:unnamed protein product, partial [Rotaria sordida]
DGLKWHEASAESLSSNQSLHITNFQLLTSSNSMNTKFFHQFSTYDKHDEKCLNQPNQEHCSTLDMKSSDKDTIINGHSLQILPDIQLLLDEKDLPIIQTKSQENETVDQPSIDNELFIINT